MRTSLIVIVLFGWMLLNPQGGWADLVYLQNGDRLSGQILGEDETSFTLEHDALGVITIRKETVKEVVRDRPSEAAEEVVSVGTDQTEAPEWIREITVGYNANRGNTDNEQFSGGLSMSRKTGHDEWRAKANGYYAASSQKMDAQRYSGFLRYAFSFGSRLAWYNFYKVEGTHDRFANIDSRFTSSTGFGYWFSDREDWTLMAEVGLGWEKTVFRNATEDRSDLVLVPRAFAKKSLFGGATLSQELNVWPNLGEVGGYRLRSETILNTPLTEGRSFRMSLINQFESNPANDADQNDLRLLSSLAYTF